MPGEAVYDSLFVSVGQNGWTVAEPGIFTLQVALHDEAGDIVSNPLTLRITPPKGYDEEYLAQDLFTEDVGRVLTFDGSRVLDQVMDVLQEISERLDGRRVAAHARIAIAATAMREFKSLQIRARRRAKGDRDLGARSRGGGAELQRSASQGHRHGCGDAGTRGHQVLH